MDLELYLDLDPELTPHHHHNEMALEMEQDWTLN